MEVSKLKNSNSVENIKEICEDEAKLPGFRFHPTDEELVGFYLKRKVEKRPLIIDLIKQIDIYKYDPWDLPMGDGERYFFCLRGRKYRNSIRPNRVTGSGFWKATGIDKPIYSTLKESKSLLQNHQGNIIGLKKSLVYYRGSAGKGTKTDWMMHEFRLPPNSHNTTSPTIALEAEVWTLCRIFKRIPSHKKYLPADSREATARKSQNIESSSKTSSLESNYSMELDSVSVMKQYKQRKPAIFEHFDETNTNNNWFVGQFRPAMTMSQPQLFPVSHPSLLNPINEHDDLFANNGSWDELRSVVELAFDPSQTIL